MESLMKRSTVRPLKKGEFRQNPDGSRSTEVTITEKFGDSFANIPSLWMQDGKIVDFLDTPDRAVAAALAYEKRTGKKFPRFPNVKSAVSAAKARSNKRGAFAGPLAK
tara:strand:+ start:254 stop:577 length:324 start_codon:yes stop_codon:yes gene_type:complete